MKWYSLTALMMWIAMSVVLAEEPPQLGKLVKGESLVVNYSSRGCFHSSDHIIVLTSKSATISSVAYERKPDGQRVEKSRELIGSVKLSKEDVKRLDALFKFYAKVPDRGCTTVDEIKVVMMKGDKEVKSHEFIDGSCATFDMKSVLTFNELMRRMEHD